MAKPHLTYKEALDYIYSFTDYEKRSAYRYAPEHFDLGRRLHLHPPAAAGLFRGAGSGAVRPVAIASAGAVQF